MPRLEYKENKQKFMNINRKEAMEKNVWHSEKVVENLPI